MRSVRSEPVGWVSRTVTSCVVSPFDIVRTNCQEMSTLFMLAKHMSLHVFALRASLALACISGSVALTGCKTTAPAGRCGLPDLCSPTVMNDPFPEDQHVPPKGVDFAHYGYTRPQWRVLTSRDSVCCVAAEQPCVPGLFEQIPEPVHSIQGQFPFEPFPTTEQPPEGITPSILPATKYTLSTFGGGLIGN
jgi:hypothetical protein